MSAVGPFTSGVAAGNAGSATNNATGATKVTGLLMGFYIQYNDSPPATTDVTIEATGGVMPTRTLLKIDNINTSGYYPVLRNAVEPAAGAAISGVYVAQPLENDLIKVTIGGADAGDSVTVWAVVYH